MPIVVFISMVPSIGGLGIREGAIVAFFTPFVGRENAFAVSLLMLASLFFLSVIGGVVYFTRNVRERGVSVRASKGTKHSVDE
jgi:uncharacterized membrane protein YbhN (UPF0104 family)